MSKIEKKFNIQALDQNLYKIICKECGKETSHKIIASYYEKGSEIFEPSFSIDWICKYQIIQCLGCDVVSFREISTFLDDYDYDEYGNGYKPEKEKYYPARIEGIRSLDCLSLPLNIQNIYKETILAIENEQCILAGIGIRALIESICKDKQALGKDLKEKIDHLQKQSIVTVEGADTLHKLRILGNDAVHEVKAHSIEKLSVALKIIEHMLDGTYIIPAKISKYFL